MRLPYSRSKTCCAPYATRSAKHRRAIEMRMRDFDSGVDMWKVTLSKSDTTWSIDAGAPLVSCDQSRTS